jgi:D-lactate dehydrogenase (cytochrome)
MNAPVAPVRLQPEFVQRPIPEAFLQALVQRFGAQCSTALAVREQHGRDEGAIQAPPPAAVVFAKLGFVASEEAMERRRACGT